MPTVAVDLEDLETLVFTTGALKTIEGALVTRKADPFVKPHLDFTAAHDRLATAMRNARRSQNKDVVVQFDEPLTREECKILTDVDTLGGVVHITVKDQLPKQGESMSIYDALTAKGCLLMGGLVKGVLWAGASAPELTVDPTGYAIKLTARGREKLASAPNEPAN